MEKDSILTEFSEQGVELWEDDGKLRYRIKKGQDAKALLTRISDSLPQILSAIRARKEREGALLQTLAPDLENRHEPFPVTGLQSAYLLGRQGFFELGNLSCQAYFEFEGEALSAQRLTEAWQTLIQRHEMLRAVFDEEGNQRILEEVPAYTIPELDLREFSPAQRDSKLEELRTVLSHQVMNPEQWPLFDLNIVFTEGEKLRLLICIDMLIADFYSIRILFMELFALYNFPQRALPALSVSFRDYVVATRGMAASLPYQQARTYWLERLPSLPPAPVLPLARNPSGIKAPSFSRFGFTLDPEDWRALKQQAQIHGVTPSVALLTVYADILGAWSNQAHFSLNLTILNRLPLHPEIMDVVGDFTTVNLLEVDVRERKTFARRAGDIQARLWMDLEHRYFDGVNVLREMSGSGGGQVSMPVVFTSTIGLGGDDLEAQEGFGVGNMTYSITQTPQVWLDFQLGELNGALMLAWDYVEGLFPEKMLESMFERFKDLVHDLARDTSAWGSEASISAPPEQLAVRDMVNNTTAAPEERLLHQLFEDRVAENPEHIAIRNGFITMTYGELAQKSDSLAHVLREKGLESQQHVAVVLEKGWQQVVGVLGVLKAGGVYLPIDVATPELRLRHLLKHGDVDIVLTHSSLLERMPGHVTGIAIDALPLRDAQPVSQRGKKEDLAYVIYTSGSTGEPKGVMIDHAGAVNTIVDINRRFNVGRDDVVLGLSSLNFDLSVYDIFGALAAGATLVLPEAGQQKESGHWLQLMQQEKITVWNSVPALMEMLLQEAQGADDPAFTDMALRLVLLSGDHIPTQLVRKIHSLFNPVACVSLGGATEASIWSIFHPISSNDFDMCAIPYGRPLANQRFYVLNPTMDPCPDWVVGDLYIAGSGLAKGYWADEDKTRQAFILHPVTGERLYRTGDLGFYRPNGDIMFSGRKDAQVKIRGHRIELGEIEATLRRYPGVVDAVVAVSEDKNQSRQIIAGVVVENKPECHAPAEDAAETASPFTALVNGVMKADENILASLDREGLSDFVRWVHQITVLEIARVCKEMGLFAGAGESVRLDELTLRHHIQPEFHPLVQQWFSLLVREGWLNMKEEGVFFRDKPFPEHPSASIPAGEFAGVGWLKPYLENAARIVRECGGHAQSIITGAADPAEVFFRESASLSPSSLNRAMPGAGEISAVLSNALEAFIQARGAEVRIFEIGAVDGADTRVFLAGLNRKNIRYTVSATSPFFMNTVRRNLKDIPELEYAIFNAERNPEEQNLPLGGFDIILGANSLHRAKDIPGLLRHLKSLLAPNGVLLFSEGTANTSLQLITAGFLERGFGGFTDERAKTNTPLLPAPRWKALLGEAGFEDAGFCPAHESTGQSIGQAVFFARMPAGSTAPSIARINDFLKQRLPEYMIPGAYAFIDKIPLSPNGKVDRKSLSGCIDALPQDKRPMVSPSTETEMLLAEIWCQILNIESVGIHEDFFGMGGDSLLANMLATQLKKRTGIRVPLGTVFEKSTIFTLGRHIDKNPHLFEQEPVMEEGLV